MALDGGHLDTASVRDVELIYILAFVVFFPFSLVYVAARWVIRRQKELARETRHVR
ncbi:MAG: hypothetical protein M3N53_06320 [Actinomycetota bacterium]|nr:hypothetical protein [Actinomycetota bacterium]